MILSVYIEYTEYYKMYEYFQKDLCAFATFAKLSKSTQRFFAVPFTQNNTFCTNENNRNIIRIILNV
jgi:hypothetical protein